MKFMFILLIISINTSTLSAEENTAIQWGKQINFALEALSITGDNFGNCFIAGTTADSLSSAYAGKKDAFVRKYDQSGNILWTINIGSDEDDYCYAIITDQDGNCILTGKTAGNFAANNSGSTDAFVVKINPSGNIIWKKQFGTPQSDELAGIITDTKGDYIVFGSTLGSFDGPSAGSADALIIKLSSAGEIIWKRQYGNPVDEKAQFASSDKNDSYYFILSSGDIIIYNRNGDFTCQNKYGISIAKGIVVDDSLNVYIGGTTGITDGSKALLVKYNKDRVKQWERIFGSGPWTGINCMKKFQDGTDDILVGVCQNYPSCMGVSRRYDRYGNVKWTNTLQKAGVNSVCGHNVAIDGKGNCYLTGFTDGDLFNTKVKSQEMFLSKISFSGNTNYQSK